MPLTWIAQRLNMGAAESLANLLRNAGKNENMRLCGTDPFTLWRIKITSNG